MEDNALNYYNTNADSFASSTRSVDFMQTQDKFLHLLPPAVTILDFGCGSGRNTKYFLDVKMRVDATDGSEELRGWQVNIQGFRCGRCRMRSSIGQWIIIGEGIGRRMALKEIRRRE